MKKILLFIVILSVGAIGMYWYQYFPTPQPTELTQEQLDEAISRGIQFLKKQQKENGVFLVGACDTTQPENCRYISSGPITAAIPDLLYPMRDNPEVRDIIESALRFVEDSMETDESKQHAAWGLFAPIDPLYGRIPPDIDDTAYTSRVLVRYGRTIPNNLEALGEYRNEGGLYYNWLSHEWNKSEGERHVFAGGKPEDFPKPQYFGVDCVVNADVLNYLALRGEQPKEVCSYLNEVIEKKLYPQCAFYYRSSFPLFSSLATAARHHGATCIAQSIPLVEQQLIESARPDGTWSSNLFNNVAAAHALAVLHSRDGALKRGVMYILSEQQDDGGWENAPIFPDLINPVFYGSRELITAIALHTLYEYRQFGFSGVTR